MNLSLQVNPSSLGHSAFLFILVHTPDIVYPLDLVPDYCLLHGLRAVMLCMCHCLTLLHSCFCYYCVGWSQIVRVVNRLHPDYDVQTTAGYRYLCVRDPLLPSFTTLNLHLPTSFNLFIKQHTNQCNIKCLSAGMSAFVKVRILQYLSQFCTP